ncbi:hypothetical protein [Algibacter sp.]|uniref:hypothetical protein n=1 Tax=Algibacter sp. TaxID=1872428 RepID=UPI003C7135CB
MKNNSTLIFFFFLITCSFSLITQAQEDKSNDDFILKVIKYSHEENSNIPHFHLLSITNNSNRELTFDLLSSVDDSNDSNNKNNQNLIIEILSEDLLRNINSITVSSKESLKFTVKITKHAKARLGSMNICKIMAQLINSNNKKSVKINSYIPNPNFSGH